MQDGEMALVEAMAAYPALDAHWMRWVTKMGDWITVLLSKVNGTYLGDK